MWVETADWSSKIEDTQLWGILVDVDARLYAPNMILGWWTGQDTAASLSCEVSGPTRADHTTLDARLTAALVPP